MGHHSFVCGCARCIVAELGVPEEEPLQARKKKPRRRWRLDNWGFWGEEDWLEWEDENFWEAMDAEKFDDAGYFDYDDISKKQQRNDDISRQPKTRVHKLWIPRMGHTLVVGESVKAHFRARQGQMSRRIENAIVVSAPSSSTVQLKFPNNGMQIVPTSWVNAPKSMPQALSKAVHPERWRNAARRRPQISQKQEAASEEVTCDVLG